MKLLSEVLGRPVDVSILDDIALFLIKNYPIATLFHPKNPNLRRVKVKSFGEMLRENSSQSLLGEILCP